MRKTIGMLCVAGSLTMGGCATMPGGNNISVADVINATVQACAFVPEASSVAGIIAAVSGNVAVQGATATVSSIAAAICAAVTAKSVRRGTRVPVVSGVIVTGHFLNGRRVGYSGPEVNGVPVSGYWVR